MAHFIKSGTRPEHYPPCEKPEVTLLGRSNAGKSSLLNALMGQSLARKSSKPGHTSLVNFFDLGNKLYNLVDLPGYGFAQKNHAQRDEWKDMIETYLRERPCLSTALLVMDCRRDWAEEEHGLATWLMTHRQIQLIVALNKVDKLNQKQRSARQKYFNSLDLQLPFYFVSAEKKKGLQELESAFDLSKGPW